MKISNIFWAFGAVAALSLQSCSLDEVNPGGFTLEALGTTPEGHLTLLNQCYFGLERKFYNDIDFMRYSEGNTDLWTSKRNILGGDSHWFNFYGNADPNTEYTAGLWNAAYDGIGACNLAIETAQTCKFKTEEERNGRIAVARFLRGVYYYNLVELFGGVVKLTDVSKTMNYAPERTGVMDIYRDVILPDFRYAVEWLAKGDETSDATPTKKAALGFLSKACLATQQYGTTEFLQEGFDAAKELINDCEGGGAKYGTFMYSDFADIFKEENNLTNKEALWKYSIATGKVHGSSNGNQNTNRNNEHFLCALTHFGARITNQEVLKSYEAGKEGDMMPTRHLLNLFVQADGTLDPRFHTLFITEWKSNSPYTWEAGDIANYGKDASMQGKAITEGDVAIRFVMPQDATYAAEVAGKSTSNYVLVDYKDVYDDATKTVIMKNGASENHYAYFYPLLTKHSSSRYYDANYSKSRFGNLNGVLVMRMSEVYIMAAEYDILLNGGANAMKYINVVRNRAGANTLTGVADIRTVLDERGRELCGEFSRFFDLKRTGMLKDATYLNSVDPDQGQYFKAEYALHPIPQSYTDVISTGASFKNPGF